MSSLTSSIGGQARVAMFDGPGSRFVSDFPGSCLVQPLKVRARCRIDRDGFLDRGLTPRIGQILRRKVNRFASAQGATNT